MNLAGAYDVADPVAIDEQRPDSVAAQLGISAGTAGKVPKILLLRLIGFTQDLHLKGSMSSKFGRHEIGGPFGRSRASPANEPIDRPDPVIAERAGCGPAP